MSNSIQQATQKMLDIIDELDTQIVAKHELTDEVDKIDQDYQQRAYGYFKYKQLREKTLHEHQEGEWLSYYNSQVLFLLKRVEQLNAQVFLEAYSDKSFMQLKASELLEVPLPKFSAWQRFKNLVSSLFTRQEKI